MYTAEMIQRLRNLAMTEQEIDEIVLEDRLLDERIQAEGYKAWLEVLVKMWDAVDKEVDQKRLAVYAEQFREIPYGLLNLAVDRAIRNNGSYLTVPSVGALWTAIKVEAGDRSGDVIEAVQLWKERQDSIFEKSLYLYKKESGPDAASHEIELPLSPIAMKSEV